MVSPKQIADKIIATIKETTGRTIPPLYPRDRKGNISAHEWIADMIEQAIQAERERCVEAAHQAIFDNCTTKTLNEWAGTRAKTEVVELDEVILHVAKAIRGDK